MKRLLLWLALAPAAVVGCTFSRGGSQALTVDPFAIGTAEPAIAPAHDNYYSNGEPLDLRR